MPNQPLEFGKDFGKPQLKTTVVALLVLFFLLVAFKVYHIVPPGHRGISVTLGKVDPQELPEGLALQWPFIQTISDFPIMQLSASGKAQCFSSDLQNLTLYFTVMYRVPANQVVKLFQQYRGDPFTTLIEPRIQESLKQVTALSRAEELVKNREKVKDESLAKLRIAVGDVLQIVDFSLTNMDLSDQLEQAIEQKVVREQEALAKSFELEKERKQAEITIVRAEAEAKSVSIKGEAIKSSPEVIQLEIAQRWDGKTPLSVSVANGSGTNILLPLK